MQNQQYRPLARLLPALCVLLLSACQSFGPTPVTPPATPTPATPVPPVTPVAPVTPPAVPTPEVPAKPPAEAAAPWRAARWSDLPGWQQDDPQQALPALLSSCRGMRVAETVKAWASTCEALRKLGSKPSREQLRQLLQTRLTPWQLINADGSEQGLITGYYEPLLRASRTRSAQFNVPVLGVPDDLITVELGDLYPELKGSRVRGRLEGRKLLPYWNRTQIDAQIDSLPARTLLYTEDPIELFFLQVQGSGQAQLPDGSRVRLAYADQNGHPYKSIGRWLIDQGELKLEQASMQGIQAWARAHPARLAELLGANPSYVFFREEASTGEGPKGSLGVPLTGMRSIAVDPRSIPLGAPVFLAAKMPDGQNLQQLMLAQDTGGAIRGRVRADVFTGFGAEAGAQAGRMRQQGRIWLLWPQDAPLPATP
ncbi:murein transglycosylase A [Uliginosibacterium sediminicola]|uniref:peptidoglycan lytic exotransglycosylase n=1 Tax=Uliginosibacterium sediminicola TaxID=2024550 RepID=A0ABU9YXG6_9RHOO